MEPIAKLAARVKRKTAALERAALRECPYGSPEWEAWETAADALEPDAIALRKRLAAPPAGIGLVEPYWTIWGEAKSALDDVP